MSWKIQILGLLLSLASLSVAQDEELVITPLGQEHTKAMGKNMVFTCSVPGADPETESNLRWFNAKGVEVQDATGSVDSDYNRRVYIEKQSRSELKLYVTQIAEENAGKYDCKGLIEGNEVQASVQLHIFEDISFDHAPSPQHPEINTDALIQCRVTGRPTPSVSWRYKGASISPMTDPRYSFENQGLRISQITQADDGEYTCRAEVASDGRLEEEIISVVVHIPPTIKRPMPPVTQGIEDNEVTIGCKADGLPSPQYEFYKVQNAADGLVKVANDGQRRVVDQMGGTLNFRPVKKDDQGTYVCRAVNDVGHEDSQGKLEVIVPPRLSEMKNVTEEEGGRKTLTCMVNANPPADMKFRKPDNDYDYETGNNEGGRVLISSPKPNRLDLTIDNLAPEDSSNYTCIAENAGGKMTVNGTIIVEYRPRFKENHPREFFAWAGKTTNITCNSMGEPEPAIQWWREDYEYSGGELKRILNNETFKIFEMGRNSALQVVVRQQDEGWIYGPVFCKAINARGDDMIEMQLTQARIPDRPESVSLKDEDPTMVVLTVVPPEYTGGMPIIGYRVEYESRIQDFQLGEQIEIENLKPSTNYIFRIRAKSEVGVGNYYEYTHTTQDIQEPRPVIIISGREGREPFKYIVQWNKPRTGGLPIQQYQFKYREVDVSATWEIQKPVSSWEKHLVQDDTEAPMLYYTLNALKSSQHYELIVLAENDIGWSLPSNSFVFRTAEGSGNNVGPVVGPVGGTASHIHCSAIFVTLTFVFATLLAQWTL